MQAPQRQRLVWLSPGTWDGLLAERRSSAAAGGAPDAVTIACLDHWARHDLPLVVTRQARIDLPGRVDPAADLAADLHDGSAAAGRADPALALGLPAPACWERRRLALRVPASGVVRVGDFPLAEAIAPLLSAPARVAWLDLCAGLEALGVVARVYGSLGWQQLTGLHYRHAGSDLDLLLAVRTPGQADLAAAWLDAAADPVWSVGLPQRDGELIFCDGAPEAWREWAGWRAGHTPRLLVKRRHGAALETGAIWADGP